jgi:hypothetical protein
VSCLSNRPEMIKSVEVTSYLMVLMNYVMASDYLVIIKTFIMIDSVKFKILFYKSSPFSSTQNEIIVLDFKII